MSLLRPLFLTVLLVVSGAASAAPVTDKDAQALIKAAIDYWRDVSSYSLSEMVIHRPDWERRMSMRVWTQGSEQSLVRVVAPAKDAGNATLLRGDDMWSYNPKINRTIKIPASMMNQSWMGSDFSNNDLARADDLIYEYDHTLLSSQKRDGHIYYVIQSVPKESAPVVWGREVVTVRDDYLLLEHEFYDQSNVLVKKLDTQEIKPMGGKLVAARQRMVRLDKPGEWTEVVTREARFGSDAPGNVFTLQSLRNPRD
jgi:outer membrane lipoprotein-sorting protein